MSECKFSNNTAMGDANKFVKRGNSETYPSPILTMVSPVRGAVEVAGASPLIAGMQVSVGLFSSEDPKFGYDWGTLTGWCISWGDGENSTGVFGSPVADADGFLYATATATHTYKNIDNPDTSEYFSEAFRPWATVTDTSGNAVATDFGSYIYVCRSDTVPDATGGCGYPVEIPPISQPPTTVCTTGDAMCIGTAGFKCVGGAWSFDPYEEMKCRASYTPGATAPACTENNRECRDDVWWVCTNGQYKATGEFCGVAPVEPIVPEPTAPEPSPESGAGSFIDMITGLPPQTLALVGVALIGGFILFGGKK